MKESKTLKSFRELNRKIFINDSTKNSVFKYIANGIQTRKYTLISFLPKSLYIQFLRIANVYFLITAVISSIGEVSSVTPITSILPLAFVLGTSIVREAFEDYKRYKNDRSINNQSASVYQKTGPNIYDFAPIRWKEIIVGDLVKVQNNEEIPADMVLLSSSDENGLAYVETANLDGERNLKLKQPNYEIKELVKKIGVAALKGAMLVEGPNQRIHHFKGIIEIEGLNPIYLNYGNLLLRGTHLKNTSHVVGLVVYTGHDSKLLRNQGTFRNKRSSIERQLNRYIVGIFVAQLAMCLLLTLLSIFFRDKYFGDSEGLRLSYLYSFIGVTEEDHSGVVQAFITFASFLLLLNTMIPISLMVSLEVAKWFQATWLEFDELMWEEEQKSKVLNMLIHEDLGRIDYVFADKTGTLTSNEMRFTHCSIGGKVYSKELLLQNLSASPTGSNEEEETEEDTMYHKFWLTIAICHDIVINNKVEEDGDPRARYQGSSPDEVELVSMASEVKYTFKEKKADIYTVNIEGKLKDFRVIVKIDFSSDRKRMSIIARDLETEKLYLFCKGADSIVLKRVKKEAPVELIEKTNDDLQMFSKEGLRTLVIAYKELEEKSFLAWHEKYYNAQLEQYNAIDNDHHAGMAALEDEIEQDLVLLGATALEDKLQEGVAETISDLHKAGIKIWMLTGDKLETAENIGYATNLIAQNTKVFKVKATNVDQALEEYKNIERQLFEAERKNMEVSLAKKDLGSSHLPFIGDNHTTFALIIDGEAISYTFHDDKLKPLFISLIPRFRTVICCRSTPNQKADVVTFVKTNLHKITLAIGDGGNDVNMIQKADIGIGLFGKEGNQAAFAADYAFVKFFFLWRLILVHGRWFYLRTSNFINYFFYKNLIFTLPQFWFGLYSAYSGQSMYDNAFITNFNTVFTSVAPVYYAAQEQDVNPRENETIRKALPYVYAEFRDKLQLFASKKFMFWWTIGVVHSIVVFYLTKFIFETPVDDNGLIYEMWNESLTAFAGVFLTVFSVMVMGTNYYHCIGFLCYIVFTLFLYFPVGSFITDEGSGNTSGLLVDALNNPKFWLALLLILTVCVLILYIPKQYQSYFYPNLVDLLQRDRNRRWKKKLSKEEAYEMRSPTKLLTSTGDFDFNQRIMLNSWYKSITVGMTTHGSMA